MSTPISVTDRVQAIAISATKRMPMIAAEVGGCVSLGQGVPSFATPPHIVDAVCRALKDQPDAGKYSLQPGMPALRQAISGFLQSSKNCAFNPDTEIGVTVGAMEALLCAMLTVVGPGDEVIIPSPSYPSHVEQVVLAQGKPVPVQVDPATHFLDPEAVAAAVTPRTRALILCNPSNPLGSVIDQASLETLCELALVNNFVIISDETYDCLVYGVDEPKSPASLPGMQHHVIMVSSFSKKYALTGWRVGFMAASKHWMAELLKVHDCTAICAPTPSQHAALAALTGPQDCAAQMKKELAKRRTLACKRLDSMGEAFSYVKPGGAFYVMARYHFTDMDSNRLAEKLIREAKVVAIPGDSFGPGGEESLRLSYGGKEAEINAAFDRLEKYVAGA